MSDHQPIDLDDLRRVAVKVREKTDDNWLADMVEIAHDEVARLREERRWVPVGERVPEHGDSVWVFDGTDVVIGEYWGTWQSYGASCDREGLNSETLLGITHWTEIREPLPPGPEGDA